MKIFLLTASILIGFTPSTKAWDYDQYGEDWTGTCASGVSQSPIDFDTNQLIFEHYFSDFDSKGKTVSALNNGHAVVFTPESRSVKVIDNISQQAETFTLVQFHLHNGSEHTINGERYDLEAHFVHANEAFIQGDTLNGRLAVFGVFLQGSHGYTHWHWNKVLSNLPEHNPGTSNETKKKIISNYQFLVPFNKKVFTYEGSLTTPDCDEIVNWVVYATPIKVSHQAVENYSASQNHHDTHRLTQPLHGRQVKVGWLYK